MAMLEVKDINVYYSLIHALRDNFLRGKRGKSLH